MLQAAAPNPFRAHTVIAYDLARAGLVDLSIFDVSGRLVRSLASGTEHQAGHCSVEWDGRDVTGGENDTRRLVRVK